MNYKEALKEGFFEMQTSRDWYREVTFDVGMHASLIERWIRTSVLLVTPIASHFAEHVWSDILGERDTVQNAPFPGKEGEGDAAALEAGVYMLDTIKMIRDAEILAQKKKNGKGGEGGGAGQKGGRKFVATRVP